MVIKSESENPKLKTGSCLTAPPYSESDSPNSNNHRATSVHVQRKNKRTTFTSDPSRSRGTISKTHTHSHKHTPRASPKSAICVQRLDDSLTTAIRTTFRISLRSSSLRDSRDPLVAVCFLFFYFMFSLNLDFRFKLRVGLRAE